jgi:catechol 2,3-dioxygenase-like lactoylglutathione lyase family enzyme
MTTPVNREFEIRGVNHLALVCKDMARTVAFYRDVLGMPLVKTLDLPGGRGQHFFFGLGNVAGAAAGRHIQSLWLTCHARRCAARSRRLHRRQRHVYPDDLGDRAPAVEWHTCRVVPLRLPQLGDSSGPAAGIALANVACVRVTRGESRVNWAHEMLSCASRGWRKRRIGRWRRCLMRSW